MTDKPEFDRDLIQPDHIMSVWPVAGEEPPTEKEIQEAIAELWTLQSQARVGGYQHELSSGPAMVLGAQESRVRRLVRTSPVDGTPLTDAERIAIGPAPLWAPEEEV